MRDDLKMTALSRVKNYVKMRTIKPLRSQDDIINGIHSGTEFEAELRHSDLKELLDYIESLEEEVKDLKLRSGELSMREDDDFFDLYMKS